MAAFTMATFPLQSCRIGNLRGDGLWFLEAIDGNGSRLGAAVVADAAAGAAFAGVLRRVDAVLVEFGGERKLFGRAGLHAQAAAFALFGVDVDVTAGLRHFSSQFSVLST
jgi:hypothetical protein